MNYLEELACWYFRLNGYFLISNFVNHQDDGLQRTHDTDILGVRFPYVIENIGGLAMDYNPDITSTEKICCIIGEVKSGRYSQDEILANVEILKKNIYRFGVFPNEQVDVIAEHLRSNKVYENDNIKVLKILVETNTHNSDRKSYISIGKSIITDDLQRRKELYRKQQDRLFFNSNLIQFLFAD